MLRLAVVTCAIAISGCGGDSSGMPDAMPLPVCTGEVYDSCQDTTNSSDCLNGVTCHEFGTGGFTVCSPSCDASTPCPDQDGVAATCNMMGRCRVAAPNACMLPP